MTRLTRRSLAASAIAAAGCGRRASPPPPERRMLFVRWNLARATNVRATMALLDRAAACGYNALVLADTKLNRLDQVGADYVANVRRVAARARALSMKVHVAVCPVGYSNSLLAHNPNLIEALPIRRAPYAVRGGVLVAEDEGVALRNASFAARDGDRLRDWDIQDSAGTRTFIDASAGGGGPALRMEPGGDPADPAAACRLAQAVELRPWRQFLVRADLRTQSFSEPGSLRIRVIGADGRDLAFQSIGASRTASWRRVAVAFNSLANEAATIYLGCWDAGDGTAWWRAPAVVPGGLMGLVRRDGCPFEVRRAGGGEPYVEGVDYARASDPLLMRAGALDEYDPDHAAPVVRLSPGRSRMREGDRVVVSGYHALTVGDGQAVCCVSEPEVYALLRSGISRAAGLLKPDGLFLQHDEVRVMNWCAACQGRALTPGSLLADNVRRCAAYAQEASPRSELLVWSDMFDPNHNMRERYYLVNGSLDGTWRGLPSHAIIVNWYFEERARSIPWFRDKGFRQVLAGFYDQDPHRIRTWLDDAGDGIAGVMYTTWKDDYSALEAFARAAWGGGKR